MLDFEKTDLIDNTLIVYGDDGMPTFIPEEGATTEEKAMFAEFRAKYPEGKPKPPVEPQEPVPTTEEKLAATQKELEETQKLLEETRTAVVNSSSDFQQFVEFTMANLSTK